MPEENLQPQQEVSFKEPEPIVQEENFPQQSSRLQKLISNYRKDINQPIPTSRENPLANTKVVNEVRTRTFESLNDNEQKEVLSRIDGIDYLISRDIQTFGSAKESPMTKHAEIIISKYSANEAGEIADPITDLVATLKSNNPKEIVKKVSVDPDKKEWGVFSSIKDMISMKNAKKKMYKALAEHESIMKNIKDVEIELKKQQLSLQKDIQVYEEMGQNTYTQISDFELDCIALDLMIEDAAEKLSAFTKKDTLDLTEMNEANMLKSAIDRMERRKFTIQTIRVSTVQSVPQLSVLICGNEIICEKIDEIESLVIPLWTWQYAIAIGAIKQKEALSIQKTIRGITSKLLTGNAKMLHDNMIAAQEELYAAAVAIEDLATVQEYIDDMVIKVNETRKQASQKCIEGMKTMQAIEQKNYSLMSKNISSDVTVK
ncbi:MAG: toxic anion resistance protein [Clostridia bacterium]|nr:toxic anion resistance protein [Clostridia bacterium]